MTSISAILVILQSLSPNTAVELNYCGNPPQEIAIQCQEYAKPDPFKKRSDL